MSNFLRYPTNQYRPRTSRSGERTAPVTVLCCNHPASQLTVIRCVCRACRPHTFHPTECNFSCTMNACSPNFHKMYKPPHLFKMYTFPSDFCKNVCFVWFNLRFLLPPYFDHDAFMHHTLHVLDAPALRCYELITFISDSAYV